MGEWEWEASGEDAAAQWLDQWSEWSKWRVERVERELVCVGVDVFGSR